MKINKLYINHVRNIEDDRVLEKGGLSLGVRLTEKDVEVVLAKCHKKDNFNKKIARDLLNERICKQEFVIHIEKETIEDIFVNELIKNKILDKEQYVPIEKIHINFVFDIIGLILTEKISKKNS